MGMGQEALDQLEEFAKNNPGGTSQDLYYASAQVPVQQVAQNPYYTKSQASIAKPVSGQYFAPQQAMVQQPMSRLSDPTSVAQGLIAGVAPTRQTYKAYQEPAQLADPRQGAFNPDLRVDFNAQDRSNIWANAQNMAGEGGDRNKALYDFAISQGYSADQIDQAMGLEAGSTNTYFQSTQPPVAPAPFRVANGYQPLLTPDNYQDFYPMANRPAANGGGLAIPSYLRPADVAAQAGGLMQYVNGGGGNAGEFGGFNPGFSMGESATGAAIGAAPGDGISMGVDGGLGGPMGDTSGVGHVS